MMFQSAFKYYKSRKPPPSFNDVLIVGDCNYPFKVVEPNLLNRPCVFPSLQPAQEWKMYEVTTHPGLFVIANPFTMAGQRYWMAASLLDYPAQPNTTNLAAKQIASFPHGNFWWEKLQSFTEPMQRRKFANTLRWSTLGYQYDWSNKIYTETRKESFPAGLAGLLRFFATVLGYERFSPEAAIVNYYPIGTTLAGHTDHSEDDLTAPLFSLSFGQPAVFLIGGTSRDEPADAILLRSGDVLVMTGASRQCYHAVPRVFYDTELPEGLEKCIDRWQPSNQSGNLDCSSMQMENRSEAEWSLIDECIQHRRININVRQVLKEKQLTLKCSDTEN
uniref:Fe2OG dioxygenase domain-containing protein n=1 Tax=Anopheles atroparvus TaxID=41427 RepID=A0AAG5DY69_ANOAO